MNPGLVDTKPADGGLRDAGRGYVTDGPPPPVLTHSALLQRVWGPERVGGAWLVRNVVKRLRRKLGDDAADPRYIFTRPRVGCRMAMGEGADALSDTDP